MLKTVVTKAEYAARKSRSPAAISHWIREGKISKAALVGEGARARIWVEQADADLAASLDPSQQLIQRAPVLPGEPPAPVLTADVTATPAPPSIVTPKASLTAEREADLARRAKADADRAEQEAIAAVRKNAVEDGRWVLAEAAAKEWAAELARYIAETETFLATTLARKLAEMHGLDFKALSVEIRNHYRRHRAEAAQDAEKRMSDAAREEEAPAAAE